MLFTLTDEQYQKVGKWEHDHDCTITHEGAIGGKITYCFTPTNIGLVEKALCACGKELDITNYDDW